MIDFLLGALFGFIDDAYMVCPRCTCEFLEEEMRYVDCKYVCPACRRPLDDSGDEDQEEEGLE